MYVARVKPGCARDVRLAASARCRHQATWRLERYSLEDPQLLELDDDTVVVAYRVHEELTIDYAPLAFEASDTSVWRRVAGEWTCALHTESLAGDAFGRGRRPA